MTETEAMMFVTDEIKARVPKITDAQCSDWVAVVMSADVTSARRFVRDIETDPDEKYLTVKAFGKRVRAAKDQSGQGHPSGKARLLYRDDGAYDVFVVNTDDRSVRTRMVYPTARGYDGGAVLRIPWESDMLLDAMQPTLREWRSSHLGNWHLEIQTRDPESHPMDRSRTCFAEASQVILAGPDTPGRSWLEALQRNNERVQVLSLAAQVAECMPAVDEPAGDITLPNRDLLERLAKPLEVSGPVMANDAFFADRSDLVTAGREPGMDG